MTCYHIGLEKRFLARYAILPGDPGGWRRSLRFWSIRKKLPKTVSSSHG